jgi:hypothetical protein
MTTPTHVITGYLLGQWFVASGLIPAQFTNVAIVVSIIAANGPDFDAFNVKKIMLHRLSKFHIPYNWFKPLSIITLIAFVSQIKIGIAFLLLIDLNIFIHFVMDSINVGHGIKWLFPYSDKDYGLVFSRNQTTTLKNYLIEVIKHPLIIIDFAIWYYFFSAGRYLFHV